MRTAFRRRKSEPGNCRGASKCRCYIAFTLGLFIFSSCCHAASDFFKGRAQGWHWYEDRPQETDVSRQKRRPENQKQNKRKPTATEIINAQKKDLEAKLHQAIVEPTAQHVLAYIEAQAKAQETAQKFSDAWMRVIYTHPHLDFTAKAPLNHVGRAIYTRKEDDRRAQKLRHLAQTHGLFFFFEGGCSYCEAFSSVVKSFAQAYGFKTLAISLDGKTLPEFPTPQHDNGIVKAFGITHVPTLLAVNPQKGHVIPLSHGFVSSSELEKRADALVASVEGLQQRRAP